MQTDLTDYIESHISAEPPHLQKLYRDTWLHRLYPRMCAGHVQGRLLKMLTAMIAPTRVLELGTFSGYSAMCIAEGMDESGEVHTVEIDDEQADSLRELFATAPGARITFHIGDALAVVPSLPSGWDMVYIDANKRHYTEYFEMVLPLVRQGGFILADNTLWDGKVATGSRDPQTLGIERFNDAVARDPRVETAIIPIRDGLTLLRKL